ncbi:MAG: hypothetical protein NZM31_05425 [Gemmatales bacterium]|nr:hypothetical protein [Gemmatales bacterium]MDW8386439.1 hypothetical protein [Gemmatales bacterium]
MIAQEISIRLLAHRRKKVRRINAQPDPQTETAEWNDAEDQERRAAYDRLICAWQTLVDDLPNCVGIRLRRGRRPVKIPVWPDRYPAGGGYRILRKPLPDDD